MRRAGQQNGRSLRARPPATGELPATVDASRAALSARERAVVERLVEGPSLKEVAADLGISVHTASTYLLRARRKQGLPSRWKLAALRLGPTPALADLTTSNSASLSEHDIELGGYMLRGLSNREIAQRLKVDEQVAARLVARLLKQMKLRTRAELFAEALRSRRSTDRPRTT